MQMPDFNFYLKNPTAEAPSLIYLQAKFNYERLTITTGEKILPTHWDVITKRAVVSHNKSEYSRLNDWLDKIVITAKEGFRDFRFRGINPTAPIIKQYVEDALQINPAPKLPEVKKEGTTLLTFIDMFIRQSSSSSRVGLETIKTYRTTKNHLLNYCSWKGTKDIEYSDINEEFYSSFLSYLHSLNLAANSVAKQIKNVKVFLNDATERGLNTNMFFKSKKFKKPQEDVDKIYLTTEEIDKIYNLDLFFDRRLEVTRDLFVIACYTGFRFSDFTSLNPEHIGDKFITKKTFKTRAKVVIPIASVVKEILAKYNNNLPKAPCNQHLNRQLKQIGEFAKINQEVEIVKTIGGQLRRNVFKKFELISSHTGRRSFATNSYLAGLPAISIMFITGHATESAFMSYICINELQNAEHIQSHSFFNATSLGQAA
jgi:integrase